METKEGTLKELHEKGEKLLKTYSEVKKLRNLDYTEWRILTGKYIPPRVRGMFTNEKGSGVIDIAEIEGKDLNKNDNFLKFFWMQVDNYFLEYMDLEDPAVRRGFMACDGKIRFNEDESVY